MHVSLAGLCLRAFVVSLYNKTENVPDFKVQPVSDDTTMTTTGSRETLNDKP